MLNMFSHVWLLLLLICCWHCMAWREGGRIPAPAHSSAADDDESGSHEHEPGSHEHGSGSHEHEPGSDEDESGSDEDASLPQKGRGCSDLKKNEGETDIDCGGSKCGKCADKKTCNVNNDCISGFCEKKKCAQRSRETTKRTTVTTRKPTRPTPWPVITTRTSSAIPSRIPTHVPWTIPTHLPWTTRTVVPWTTRTRVPSTTRTTAPSTNGTAAPSTTPTAAPATNGTAAPATNGTDAPSTTPTAAPATNGTAAPSTTPTAAPATNGTAAPATNGTDVPSTTPTAAPATNGTDAPSTTPTARPSRTPTHGPWTLPTHFPFATWTIPTHFPFATWTIPTHSPFATWTIPTHLPFTTRTAAPSTSGTAASSTNGTAAPSTNGTAAASTTPSEVRSTTPTAVPSTTPSPVPSTTSPTCDFECKNNGTCTGRNQCTCKTGFSGSTCEAQSTGLCLNNETFGTKPILQITFGNGSDQFSTATPARFNFNTTYRQRFEPRVEDGYFSLINSIYDQFDAWHTNAKDHTGDNNGYMYLVNADYTPGRFYNGRVNNLCVGLRYEFSVYLANLCKPSNRIKPNVLFEVRSVVNNTLLAQLESGDIAEHGTLTWKKYGFSFIAPSSSVNLLMISNAQGGDGNDIVIDDIALRVCANEGTGFCPTN